MSRVRVVIVVAAVLAGIGCSNEEAVQKAQAAADQARAEAEKAGAEAAQARAEAEKARAEAAQAQTALAAAEQARSQAAQAQQVASGERLTRQKNEAPAKVAIEAMGCRCRKGMAISVTCRVRSDAELPVTVALKASAETGSFGLRSEGLAPQPLTLRPGQEKAVEIPTKFNGLTECSACASPSCEAVSVTTKDTR